MKRQACALRDALERSEENTQSMVAVLASFDRRVSAIEATVRPAQVRTQAIAMAHENIDRTIGNAEAVLAQFDIVRRSSSTPSDVISSGVSRNIIKERFKSFNIQFEELHAKQSQWTIPDQELRDNLRLAVAEVLLPAYRSFINRFGHLVQRGKNLHKYIKHSPEALDQLLGQFFQGLQVGEQKR